MLGDDLQQRAREQVQRLDRVLSGVVDDRHVGSYTPALASTSRTIKLVMAFWRGFSVEINPDLLGISDIAGLKHFACEQFNQSHDRSQHINPHQLIVRYNGSAEEDSASLMDGRIQAGEKVEVLLTSTPVDVRRSARQVSFMPSIHDEARYAFQSSKTPGVRADLPDASIHTPMNGRFTRESPFVDVTPGTIFNSSQFDDLATPFTEASGIGHVLTSHSMFNTKRTTEYPSIDPYETSLLNTTFTEQVYETRVRPEEERFHSLFSRFSIKTGVRTGELVDCIATQAMFAQEYAEVLDQVMSDSKMAFRRGRETDLRQKQLLEALRYAKAERDLWALLSNLTDAGLFCDFSESLDTTTIKNVEAKVPDVDVSTEEVINLAYSLSHRLKKGRVLKDWLEYAAQRDIEFNSPNKGSWVDTYKLLSRPENSWLDSVSSRVPSLHPDAQLKQEVSSLRLLQLHGNDAIDQQSLMWAIWLCIRSGKLEEAQKLARENDAFWLACILLGESEVYYTSQTDSEIQVPVERRGNANRALWLNTCVKYADKLQKNKENFSGTNKRFASLPGYSKQQMFQLTEIEVAIYSALSNNLSLLLNSPLLSYGRRDSGDGDVWVDKIWAVFKASHENDLLQIVHSHHSRRAKKSDLYLDSSEKILNIEDELIRKYKSSEWSCEVASCGLLFDKLKPPNYDKLLELLESTADLESPISITAEDILLYLQCCLMAGTSATSRNIQQVSRFLSIRSKNSFPGKSRVLRIYCHLVLWLRYSFVDTISEHNVPTRLREPDLLILHPRVFKSDFTILISAYVQHLIAQKQRTLVASYIACLPFREDRIYLYLELLKSMQISLEKAEDAMNSIIDRQNYDLEEASVVKEGREYLPRVEMLEICRRIAIDKKHPCAEIDIRGTSGRSIPITVSASGRKRVSNTRNEGKLELTHLDKRSIEMLRWLFYTPEHHLEASRQSHILLSAFILQINKGDSRDLVRKCDSNFDRKAAFNDAWKEAKKVDYFLSNVFTPEKRRDVMRSLDGSRRDAFENSKAEIESHEDDNTFEILLLVLWGKINEALSSLDKWNSEILEFSTSSKAMLGDSSLQQSMLSRFPMKLSHLADISISLFMNILQFKADTSSEYESKGINFFLNSLKDARLKELWFCIDKLRDLCQSELYTNPSLQSTFEMLHDKSDLMKYLNEEDSLIDKIFVECDDLLLGDQTTSYFEWDTSIRMFSSKGKSILDVFRTDQKVFSCICNMSITCILGVFNETASVYHKVKDLHNASEWYLRGVELASFIASEEYGLYEIIEKKHLERILDMISESTICRLSLDQSLF